MTAAAPTRPLRRPAESDVPAPPVPPRRRVRVYCTAREPGTDRFIDCAWLVVTEKEKP